MNQIKLKKLVCAALFLIAAPVVVQANDISIYRYTPIQPFDPNDPLMQIVSIGEVDVWERLRQGFAIPDLDNPLVATQANSYTSRPEYFERITTRGSRYLFYVVQELEKRNMPTELALLPVVESAFNPQAYSSAKASGLWQFMPATGLYFDLKQNVFKDERRDVIASTDAALTYLQKLHGMFGDWHLALAAYNWGEGSVQRALKKARAAGTPTDFNGLSIYMPAETRNYVPKLQAVKNIIASPDQYAIALPRLENQPYFVTVKKTRDIDIKIAAQLAELPMDEFKALNPQFNRPIITGSENTQILLPKGNAEKFKENLGKWSRTLSSWTVHKITNARERIETIAAKFKTTPEVIREANNIPPKMALKAGSTILVPRPEHAAEANISAAVADSATMVVVPDVADNKRVLVKVGKGDTLSSIASRHNVSMEQIKNWNGMKSNAVRIGQSLQLHGNSRVASTKKPSGKQVAKANAPRPSAKLAKSTPSAKPASGKTVTASAKTRTFVASSSAKSPR